MGTTTGKLTLSYILTIWSIFQILTYLILGLWIHATYFLYTECVTKSCDPPICLSLSDNNQADIIEAFNSTSRYLDDLLNIDNPYFEQMLGQIYPTELQLNKANSSDPEAPFLDLNLPITNGIVSSKMYEKTGWF